ncbi:MAG: DUF4286 family protein [Gammaproteobacteria bacterium]|nr:DUF4286 family protein [Gammaproteobacteria bacterium]
MDSAHGQLIYEVTLDVSPDILTEYDAWLEDHVAEMLTIPGFMSAEISHIDPQEGQHDDWPRRCVRYRVAKQDVFDDYLQNHAPRMRALGVEKFGDQFRASRRILRDPVNFQADVAEAETLDCPNCDTPLHGQYCWQCGQRSRVRLITLWELISEAVGDLFELDSRLWRSLKPLMFRPGLLTSDYLAGRRARYMPPFRMYLVLSIIFFLVWSLNASEFRVTTNGDAGGQAISERLSELEQLQQTDPDPERQKKIEALKKAAESLGLDNEADESEDNGMRIVLGGDSIKAEPGSAAVDAISGASPYEDAVADAPREIAAANEPAKSIEQETEVAETAREENSKVSKCDELEYDFGWGWLNERIGEERITAACRKIERDKGKSFGKAMLDNLPAMMFIFLPLLALALKVLYLGSGRYYVEHLLFTVHYHAFFFLIVTLTIIVHANQDFLHVPDWLVGIYTAVVILYIQPVYLYKALRRVYQQGHIATFIRWALLSVAYIVAMITTILVGVIYTALTL